RKEKGPKKKTKTAKRTEAPPGGLEPIPKTASAVPFRSKLTQPKTRRSDRHPLTVVCGHSDELNRRELDLQRLRAERRIVKTKETIAPEINAPIASTGPAFKATSANATATSTYRAVRP